MSLPELCIDIDLVNICKNVYGGPSCIIKYLNMYFVDYDGSNQSKCQTHRNTESNSIKKNHARRRQINSEQRIRINFLVSLLALACKYDLDQSIQKDLFRDKETLKIISNLITNQSMCVPMHVRVSIVTSVDNVILSYDRENQYFNDFICKLVLRESHILNSLISFINEISKFLDVENFTFLPEQSVQCDRVNSTVMWNVIQLTLCALEVVFKKICKLTEIDYHYLHLDSLIDVALSLLHVQRLSHDVQYTIINILIIILEILQRNLSESLQGAICNIFCREGVIEYLLTKSLESRDEEKELQNVSVKLTLQFIDMILENETSIHKLFIGHTNVKIMNVISNITISSWSKYGDDNFCIGQILLMVNMLYFVCTFCEQSKSRCGNQDRKNIRKKKVLVDSTSKSKGINKKTVTGNKITTSSLWKQIYTSLLHPGIIFRLFWTLTHEQQNIGIRVQKVLEVIYRIIIDENILSYHHVEAYWGKGLIHCLIGIREKCRVDLKTLGIEIIDKYIILMSSSLDVDTCKDFIFSQDSREFHAMSFCDQFLNHLEIVRANSSNTVILERLQQILISSQVKDESKHLMIKRLLHIMQCTIRKISIIDDSPEILELLSQVHNQSGKEAAQIRILCEDKLAEIIITCPRLDKLLDLAPGLAMKIINCEKTDELAFVKVPTYMALDDFMTHIEYGVSNILFEAFDFKKMADLINIAHGFHARKLIDTYFGFCELNINNENVNDLLKIALSTNSVDTFFKFAMYIVQDLDTFNHTLVSSSQKSHFCTLVIDSLTKILRVTL